MDTNNITSIIISTINTIFSKIFSSIDNNVYGILDDFTFINSDILNDGYFSKIFGISSGNGILIVANSLVFGILIYYGFRLMFSHLGITESERPSKFIFKLIICGICMNFSLFICDEIIYINSLFSGAIRIIGEDLFGFSITFSTLINKLNTIITINTDALDIFSLDGIIKSLVSFGILNLVITYSIRYVLVKVFVILSPFAFLTLATKPTSIIFKSWIKAFLSLLLIQDFVAVVLLLVFSLDLTPKNMFSKFILIAAIFILIKSNSYVRELFGGISTDFSIGINNLKSMIKK